MSSNLSFNWLSFDAGIVVIVRVASFVLVGGRILVVVADSN